MYTNMKSIKLNYMQQSIKKSIKVTSGGASLGLGGLSPTNKNTVKSSRSNKENVSPKTRKICKNNGKQTRPQPAVSLDSNSKYKFSFIF